MLFRLNAGIELALASASPRRKELLASLGLPFAILRPESEEPRPFAGESPPAYSIRCAKSKLFPPSRNCVAISADTIVCVDEEIYGKPRNNSDALRMLQKLNGNTHVVVTSFCLWLPPGRVVCRSCRSTVKFHSWPLSVLEAYARSGEPLDKAGAYAVQGNGSFLIESINGSWTNVMGMPMSELTAELLAEGIICVA